MEWYNATPLTTDKSMAKQVKQWLVVYDEIFYTDENANRYIALTGLCVRRYGLSLSVNSIKNNGKLMFIATLEAHDSEEYFKEFCDMADKVNGLYCVSDIFDNAIRVLTQ